jgi:hypothetical protein
VHDNRKRIQRNICLNCSSERLVVTGAATAPMPARKMLAARKEVTLVSRAGPHNICGRILMDADGSEESNHEIYNRASAQRVCNLGSAYILPSRIPPRRLLRTLSQFYRLKCFSVVQ